VSNCGEQVAAKPAPTRAFTLHRPTKSAAAKPSSQQMPVEIVLAGMLLHESDCSAVARAAHM
jgi:hypothetical protein